MGKVYLLLYLVYALMVAFYAGLRPAYNWDIIPYVAIAISFEEHDKEVIHQRTYAYIQQSVPPPIYAELTKDGYRAEMRRDYRAFSQQLPLYQVRPLYTSLIYLVYKTGINIVTAAVLTSVVPSLIIVILVLIWLRDHLADAYAYVLAPLIIQSVGVVEVARISTPDALSAAAIILCLYIISQERLIYLASLLLLLAIFIRTDNIIIVLIVFTYLRFVPLNKYVISPSRYALLVVVSAICYFSVNYLVGNYGWDAIFYHTLIEKINNPLEHEVNVTLVDYMRVLFTRGVDEIFNTNSTFFFLLCGFITVFLIKMKSDVYRCYKYLSIMMILAIFAHFMLFPVLWNRFFVANYTIISISLVVTLVQFIQSKRRVVQSAVSRA